MNLTPSQQAVHHRLQTDFPFFAQKAPLMIKGKKPGEFIPLILNRAQRHIHAKLEEQKRKTGKVRALILKGRQQGCSTYTEGRFYHAATRNPGTSVFVLSHEGKTTEKIFSMVRTFQENIHPALRPIEGTANTRQLSFPEIRSDYAVGTAGNENVGRGGTAQYFHGSEVAYWEHAYAIQDGALESIGDVAGTEIILESTANGPMGLFYEKCMDAIHGIGDYILIFVPWFWQDEYERDDDGSELTEEENAYISFYLKEFTPERARRKTLWRRAKIIFLSTGNNRESGEAKFRQIYPATPAEAFQSTGVGLFRADAVMAARQSTLTDETAPTVAGVDPAGDSDNADRTVIAIRQGRHLRRVIKYPRMRPMELAGIIVKLIDEEGLDMVFIDRGYGEGTIDRLHELGFRDKVQGVAFNERTLYPELYSNKRSEIIIEFAKWLNAGGVRIPDDEEIHTDLACVPLDQETSNGLKYIMPKRELKKLLKRSTDIVDAGGLTFAYPVRRSQPIGGGVNGSRWKKVSDDGRKSRGQGKGPLRSLSFLKKAARGGR